MKYTLEEAVQICKWLEPQLAERYAHCGLTGSCLYREGSEKDYDIIIYSHHGNPTNHDFLAKPIELFKIIQELFPQGHQPGNPDYPRSRLLWRVEIDGKRLEFFIMEG